MRNDAILLIQDFLLWGEHAARRHGSRENSPRSRNLRPYAPEAPAQVAGGGRRRADPHGEQHPQDELADLAPGAGPRRQARPLSTNPARTGSGAGSRRRPSRWRRSPPPSFGASSRPLAPFVCRAASAAAVAARRRIPTRCVRCRCCIRRPRIGPSGTHRTPGTQPAAYLMGPRLSPPWRTTGSRAYGRSAPRGSTGHGRRYWGWMPEEADTNTVGNRLATPRPLSL